MAQFAGYKIPYKIPYKPRMEFIRFIRGMTCQQVLNISTAPRLVIHGGDLLAHGINLRPLLFRHAA